VPRSTRSLLAAVAVLLLSPAAASAAPVEIDGSPLNIWTDEQGSLQVNVDGYPASEWFPQTTFDPITSTSIPNNVANAGFGIVIDPQNTGQVFGKFIAGNMPAPSSGPTLAPGNPATVTTTWPLNDPSGAPQLEVTQVISYTNGSRQFDASYAVKNVGSQPITFRAGVAGDLAIRGSDSGIGFLDGGPPRFVGGLNQDVGAAGGFVEETPWSHFEVNAFGTVRSDAASTGPTGLTDVLERNMVDNGAGVEWDDHFDPASALAPGATATYTVGERYVDTLGLTPPVSTKLTGDTATLTVNASNVNGSVIAAKTIDYTVRGVNDLTGKVTTDAKGHATISYIGGAAGQDNVIAFVDLNGNGARDTSEPQATAVVNWNGVPVAPVIGSSAGVRPVTGTVKVKLPPGTSAFKARKLGLSGAASGFVKLTQAKTIPMGSTLDTSRGTVSLLSSASKNPSVSKFQSGNFNGGTFRLSQTTKNPLTQLSMQGGGLSSCKTRVPSGGSAARVRRRKLFGNAHGHFRTRGRNSSATVRGTKWTMTDTCSGTLTVVQRGVVTVRDFTLRKNKTVKAGRRYFAKAPKLRVKH
jgi:hypothetical protein